MLKKHLYMSVGILIALSLQNCSCDCRDVRNVSFTVDFKSYNTDIPINEFLYAADSLGKPKYYTIKYYYTDSTFRETYFSRRGNGKGGADADTLASFSSDFSAKKITIEINKIGLKHTFTKFNMEGDSKGGLTCKCFKPTKKTVVIDDSATLDILNKDILLEKL